MWYFCIICAVDKLKNTRICILERFLVFFTQNKSSALKLHNFYVTNVFLKNNLLPTVIHMFPQFQRKKHKTVIETGKLSKIKTMFYS